MALLFGVVLWVISSNVVTPFVVPLVVLAIAALAAEFYASQAWSYIPGKRADRNRGSGGLLELAGAVIDAIALVSALLIFIAWASARSFPEGVAEVTIGIGVGIVLIQIAELMVVLLRHPRHWTLVVSKLLALVAMATVILVASATLIGDRWSSEAFMLALIGGASIVAIQLLLSLIRFIGARRSATQPAEQSMPND